MLKFSLVFIIGLIPWSCSLPLQKTTQQAEEEVSNNREVEVPAGARRVLPISSSVSTYENGREKIVSSLKLEESSSKVIIQDQNWNTNWGNTNLSQKVVFWTPENYQSVRQFDLKQSIAKNMGGFDFAPIITYMDNAKPWEGGNFVQQFITFPTTENRNTWTEGGLTYYFMPNSYVPNPDSKLPQYVKNFPAYELPNGKISVNNFSIYGNDDANTLKKGHSFLFSYSLPNQYRSWYDYDDWLYAAGCPKAYSASQEAVEKWLDGVDDKVLLRSFKNNFYEKYKDYGYVVMNWEAIGFARTNSFWKLQKCFDYWFSQKPKTKLAIWGKGAFGISRVQIEGNNYEYKLTKALVENQPLDNFKKGINQENPVAADDFYANNTDVSFIGGYMNYPTNFGYIHHMLIQHMFNKKYYPQKLSVLSWWHNIEYGPNFKQSDLYFKGGGKNEILKTQVKPMVFPEAMHNAAVWSHAFCDGGDLWSEPFGRMENPKYLGPFVEAYNLKGQKVSSTFLPNSNGQYAIQNYSNIDRWEGGKWAISQSKDIIDAKGSWGFAAASRDNRSFTRNESTLPSASLYQKTPLVAIKYSSDKKEALLLVYDAWNDPIGQNLVFVSLNGRVYEIKVFGKYTSVVRVQLD